MYVTLPFTGIQKRLPETCVMFIIILLEEGKSAEIQCHNSFKIKLVVNEFGCVMKHCSYSL